MLTVNYASLSIDVLLWAKSNLNVKLKQFKREKCKGKSLESAQKESSIKNGYRILHNNVC